MIDIVLLLLLLLQTLRGHEHVVETVCYGKKPLDAAAIVAAAAATTSPVKSTTSSGNNNSSNGEAKDTQVRQSMLLNN